MEEGVVGMGRKGVAVMGGCRGDGEDVAVMGRV